MPTDLAHIQDGQLDEAVFNVACYSWGVGPLNLEACVDLSAPSVAVTVTLMGVRIGGFTIDPQHTEACAGGSVDGFKAEVCLTGNFDARTLIIKADLCVPIWGCKTYETTIDFGQAPEPRR